jgi:hypothetical protein
MGSAACKLKKPQQKVLLKNQQRKTTLFLYINRFRKKLWPKPFIPITNSVRARAGHAGQGPVP